MKRLLSYFLLLILVACSQIEMDRDGDSILEGAKCVELQTKGTTGDKRTYRFSLNSSAGNEYVGTYCDVEKGSPLVPCEVDPTTGTAAQQVEKNSEKGLSAPNGNYRMYIASPACSLKVVDANTGLKGYPYSRNQNGVYVSEVIDVALSGVYLSESGSSQYIFNASNHVLRQPRSQIKLKFACGSDIESTTLQYINLKNFIETGYYIPIEERFHYTSVESKRSLYSTPTTLTKNQDKDLNVQEYLLSMNYRETDAQGNNKWPLPSLEIAVGEKANELVTFTADLAWDFKPQNVYEFTIKINSVSAYLTMIIYNWVPNSVGDVYVKDPGTWQIEIPLSGENTGNLNWKEVGTQTGTIK
jgi:hypothetical protein